MKENTLRELILLEKVVRFEKAAIHDCNSSEGFFDGGDIHVDISQNKREQPKKQKRQQRRQQSSSMQQNTTDSVGGSFATWRKVLSERQYHVGHFHLDPTHVGIPNNRPRYYCIAFRNSGCLLKKLRNSATRQISEKDVLESEVILLNKALKSLSRKSECDNIFLIESLDKPPIIYNEESIIWKHSKNRNFERVTLPKLSCINSFLDANLSPLFPSSKLSWSSTSPSSQFKHITASQSASKPLQRLDSERTLLQIPKSVRTSSSSWCFDIVTPYHHRSSCFTHSYGKFIRGTGSILYMGPIQFNGIDIEEKEELCKAVIGSYAKEEKERMDDVPSIDRFRLALPCERIFDSRWSEGLNWDRDIRYFSGTEIARLMGFPVLEPAACGCNESCENLAEANNAKAGNGIRKYETGYNMQNEMMTQTFRKFSFPSNCTLKQQWKLLGNSLNVQVAASVAEIGIWLILNKL